MAIIHTACRLAIPPFVLAVSLPLALFAWATTTLAMAVLLCRVTAVYFEMAFIVIPHYLLGHSPGSEAAMPRLTAAPSAGSSPPRRKKHRSSNAGSLSSPIDHTHLMRSATALGLAQSIGPARDYEGIGGWRLDGGSDGEGPWSRANVEVEPAANVSRRHHHRSFTSGAVPLGSMRFRDPGEEAVMNTSRVRTPSSVRSAGDSYSPLEMRIGGRKKRSSPILSPRAAFGNSIQCGMPLHPKQA